MAISDEDYRTLEKFVGTVIERTRDGQCNQVAAVADIMHPLTAWDKGNQTEFGPWMRARLAAWETPSA